MSTDERLYNAVVRQITAMIDSGQFPPGSRLPGERDLAAQLGVSRVTVREAQIALQAQRRIEVRTGSGAKVLAPSAGGGGLPDVNAFELTQARTLFESEAAALAATIISDEEVAVLEALVQHMREDTGQEGGSTSDSLHEDADRGFHLTIAKATKNAAIIETVERLWQIRTDVEEIRLAYDAICGITPEMRLAEHQAIVDALRARDPVRAREAMRKHFACITEAMLAATEEQAIEDARRRTTETRQRFLENAAAFA